MRAVTTTPVGPSGASLVTSPTTAAFPVIVAGRLPHWTFRGLLGVHCALRPARPADSLDRSRFWECFSPFVTSWTAPSASGWDDIRRSGLPPEDSRCLYKAHTTTSSERALRILALGRNNCLFVGHDEAGQNLAILQSLVATCKLHEVNPYDYLVDVLIRVQSHPQARIEELLPMNWQPPTVS